MTRLMGLCGDGICKHCGALNTLQVELLFTVCSGHVPSLFFHMAELFWKPMENVPSHKVMRLRTNRRLEFAGNEPLCQVQGKQCHVKVSVKL